MGEEGKGTHHHLVRLPDQSAGRGGGASSHPPRAGAPQLGALGVSRPALGWLSQESKKEVP